MEFIERVSQFEKMIDNKIIGMPHLINSKINFRGKNNILVCDNNIKLDNIVLDFNGDNTIVYLASDLKNSFHLVVYNNSTVFFGRDVDCGSFVNLEVYESNNLIIGDDCVIEDNVCINTSDKYPIYDVLNKERVNYSDSVYVGDHVWIGRNVFISKGTRIGSGTIVGNKTYLAPNVKIPSNVLLIGNPAKIIKKDVFFTKNFVGPFKSEDSINSQFYKSDVFIFNVVNQETLSIESIEKVLNELDVESRWEFIQKLFIRSKKKNRFSVQ